MNEDLQSLERQVMASRKANEAFAASRRLGYLRRPSYHHRLDSCAQPGTSPLCIYAPSGTGKSSLLASWAEEFRRNNPTTFLLECYVGSNGETVDALSLLRYVMMEIKVNFELKMPLPSTPNRVLKDFPRWLWSIAYEPDQKYENGLIIFDALNQLKGDEHDLNWLPDVFPSTAQCFVSTTNRSVRDGLVERGWDEMELAPFTLNERRNVVRQFVRSTDVSLTREQLSDVAQQKSNANPLLLRTRLEEVSLAHTDDDERGAVQSLLEADSLETMYQRVLDRLTAEYGEGLVRGILVAVWGTKTGITESELHRLHKLGDEEVSLLVTRLKFHLLRNEGRFTFFHDYFRKAIESRWLTSETERRTIHRQLADYFLANRTGLRERREALHHLREIEEWVELGENLAEAETILSLYEGAKFELLSLWNVVGEECDAVELYGRSVENYHRDHGDGGEFFVLLKTTGNLLRTIGRWDAAEKMFHRGLQVSQSVGDPMLEASARLLIGDILLLKGDHERAEQYFRDALALIGVDETKSLRGVALRNLGVIAFRKGDDEKALNYFQANLVVAQRHADTRESVRALGNIGSGYARLGKFNEAEESFLKMKKGAEQIGDLTQIAVALGNLGTAYFEQARYDDAFRCFREQLELVERVGDKRQIAFALGKVGHIHFIHGDYSETLSFYEKRKTIVEQLGDRQQLAIVVNNIAEVFTRRGEYEEALQHHDRALKISEEINDVHLSGDIFHRVGYVYLAMGNHKEAQAWFDRQRELGQATNTMSVLNRAYANLSRTHFERRDVEGALRFNEDQYAVAKSMGEEFVAETLRARAILFRSVHKWQEAEDVLEEVIDIYGRSNRKRHVLLAHCELADLRLDKALSRKDMGIVDTVDASLREIESDIEASKDPAVEFSSALLRSKVEFVRGEFKKVLAELRLLVQREMSDEQRESIRRLLAMMNDVSSDKETVQQILDEFQDSHKSVDSL